MWGIGGAVTSAPCVCRSSPPPATVGERSGVASVETSASSTKLSHAASEPGTIRTLSTYVQPSFVPSNCLLATVA